MRGLRYKNKILTTFSLLSMSLLVCWFSEVNYLSNLYTTSSGKGMEQPLKKEIGRIDTNRDSIADSNLMNEIYRGIKQREYQISFDKKGRGYQSPNRRHNIRSFYRGGQWEMQNRMDSAGHNWKLTMKTEGIYADGKRIAVPTNEPTVIAKDNQVDFNYPLFTEQYINNPQGVRQNFIVRKAPENTRSLAVKLCFSGMEALTKNENEIIFTDKKNVLIYSGLKVWDASGAMIDARMELNRDKKSLLLIAQVENAVFPLTIDPIITNNDPDATLEVNQAESRFGCRVSGGGGC